MAMLLLNVVLAVFVCWQTFWLLVLTIIKYCDAGISFYFLACKFSFIKGNIIALMGLGILLSTFKGLINIIPEVSYKTF